MVKTTTKLLSGIAFSALCVVSTARAAEIDTNMAQMQAMDKITGRVSVIDIPVNGSVNFGSFSIVVRSCKTRPPEDTPENFAFVDVVDNYKTETPVNIFRGWMISSSPALNPVEHPIYDVWLLKCINGNVKPSQILSKEELAQRDALPKAPIFTEEAKLKANEEQKDETPSSDSENIVKTEEKEVSAAPLVSPMEEKQLENLNISNPPALDQEILQQEPVVQEDGAPKSLLNIGNDFVPQEQDAMPDKNAPEEVSVEDNESKGEEKAAETENFATGFLGKFLSSDEGEQKSNTLPEEKASASSDVLTNNQDSSIDVNEIDKELMLMQ